MRSPFNLDGLLDHGALNEGAEPLRHRVVEVAPVRPIAERQDEGHVLLTRVVVADDVLELELGRGRNTGVHAHVSPAERDAPTLPEIPDVSSNGVPLGQFGSASRSGATSLAHRAEQVTRASGASGYCRATCSGGEVVWPSILRDERVEDRRELPLPASLPALTISGGIGISRQ